MNESERSSSIRLTLPWPPTVNLYYIPVTKKTKAGKNYPGRVVSKQGKKFKVDVFEACHPEGRKVCDMGKARISLQVYCFPPDKRRRDLDNLGKALQDSLVDAGVFEDDASIDILCFYRREVVKGGKVMIEIEEI